MTFYFWRSTSLRATLQRPLPGEVVIVSQAALKGSEGREFDTPGLKDQPALLLSFDHPFINLQIEHKVCVLSLTKQHQSIACLTCRQEEMLVLVKKNMLIRRKNFKAIIFNLYMHLFYRL